MLPTQTTTVPQWLCGFSDFLLSDIPGMECQLHHQVIAPFLALRDEARAAGFDLQVASSYRSIARQLHIWNAKASGQRTVLDSYGEPLDISVLSERDLVFAILRWSALPGASRHHWGTDFDVYDGSALAPGYQLQLTVAETEGEGPFAAFHLWLTEILAQGNTGFYRPYAVDRGGVAPEPWHLSYAPVAREFSEGLTEAVLREYISASEMLLKETVLENLSEIYQRFVQLDC